MTATAQEIGKAAPIVKGLTTEELLILIRSLNAELEAAK